MTAATAVYIRRATYWVYVCMSLFWSGVCMYVCFGRSLLCFCCTLYAPAHVARCSSSVGLPGQNDHLSQKWINLKLLCETIYNFVDAHLKCFLLVL